MQGGSTPSFILLLVRILFSLSFSLVFFSWEDTYKAYIVEPNNTIGPRYDGTAGFFLSRLLLCLVFL